MQPYWHPFGPPPAILAPQQHVVLNSYIPVFILAFSAVAAAHNLCDQFFSRKVGDVHSHYFRYLRNNIGGAYRAAVAFHLSGNHGCCASWNIRESRIPPQFAPGNTSSIFAILGSSSMANFLDAKAKNPAKILRWLPCLQQLLIWYSLFHLQLHGYKAGKAHEGHGHYGCGNKGYWDTLKRVPAHRQTPCSP